MHHLPRLRLQNLIVLADVDRVCPFELAGECVHTANGVNLLFNLQYHGQALSLQLMIRLFELANVDEVLVLVLVRTLCWLRLEITVTFDWSIGCIS